MATPSSELPLPVPVPVRDDDYHSDDDDDRVDASAQLLHTPTKQRTYSVSSLQFDFTANLLLTASSDDPDSHTARSHRAPAEPVSIVAGCSLIVGMIIGSGIFSSPGVVARETGSVASALILWAGAGLLSWAGASSFVELGSALPLNGGAQVYLETAFSPLLAYCFSFTAVTALKPGSQAIISM